MPRNYSVAETIRRAKEKYESQNLPKEQEEFIEHIPAAKTEPEVVDKEQQEIITEPEPVIQAQIYQPPEESEPELQEEQPQGLLTKISKKLKWW